MPTYTFPIVGAHYRPPAKAILAVLPNAASLTVAHEPDNPFDPNAIAIGINTADIGAAQYNELATHGRGYGYELEAILAEPWWHLGYVPATQAVNLAPMLTDYTPTGTLTFTSEGKPAVAITLTPRKA